MGRDRITARAIWTALALERLVIRAEEASARRQRPTRITDVSLTSPLGHPLPARLHLPDGPGPFPTVFFCPGGLDGARGVEGLSPVLPAQRLARAGYAAFAWTPSGREGALGPEDRNGPLHQEEAARALTILLERPEVDPERIGVLSISFGVALAVGALTSRPDLAACVRGLLDWEGPPTRGWFLASRLEYRTTSEEWWEPREAGRAVGRLRCPYGRYQSAWDHVHGDESGLGDEMVAAALAGDGSGGGPPEVRLNGVVQPEPEPARRRGPISVRAQREELLGLIQGLLSLGEDPAASV